MKNQAIIRDAPLVLLDKPVLLSMSGYTYNTATDNAKAQIPMVLSGMERNIA